MLKVLIIGNKNGQRIQPLLNVFSNDGRFDLEFWEPVYLKSFNDERLIESGFNVNKSTAYTSRELTLEEIGCCLAHNRARKELASNESGGVILEDDARIPNLDYFYSSATLFLDSIKIPAVLNFASRRIVEDFRNSFMDVPSLRKQSFHSPGNVGYVLNKLGAEMLSNSDYRLYMMCDWPFSKVNKYVLTFPAVAHGDAENISTIDPANLIGRDANSWRKSWPNRIKLFSFYWYMRHRSKFTNLHEYINVMLVPRIFYQLNRLSLRFRKRTIH